MDLNRGALLTDRVGEVLGALTRMRPWHKTLREGLAQLLGSVAHNRTRITSQQPWHTGLAVGSGAVEGACTPVMHRRLTRAGMRWKPPGVLHGLAWRIASLNERFEAFWASRGLTIQAARAPTQ